MKKILEKIFQINQILYRIKIKKKSIKKSKTTHEAYKEPNQQTKFKQEISYKELPITNKIIESSDMTKQSPQNPYYLPPHPMYYHYPYYPHNLSHDYSYNNSPNLDLQASSHTFNSPTTTATKNIEKNISQMVSEKIEDIIVIDDPKDKKSVQFTLLKNDNLQQNDENITKTTRSTRSTCGK